MRYVRIPFVKGWILLLCLCGLSLSLATARVLEGLTLLTPEEAQQLRVTDQDVVPPVFTRAIDSGPRIIIQRPQVMDTGGEAVIDTMSPTDLFVLFEATQAPVDMNSLDIAAYKGPFSKSLTPQLKPYVQGSSLQAMGVTIPAGQFLIQIAIADQNGVKTVGKYRLRVNDK